MIRLLKELWQHPGEQDSRGNSTALGQPRSHMQHLGLSTPG